jgi:hypothetical protein
MRRYGAVLLLVVAVLGIGTATSAIRRQNPPAHHIRTHNQINQDQWPAVDYDSPVAQKRPDKASGKPGKSKYEHSPMMVNPLDESEQTTITHGETDSLPALPLGLSDVVLVGQVTDAKSYLSADKTGVYSEFTVQAVEVLKDAGESPITLGSSLAVQRAGGRVRFSSGRLHLYSVANERMPLIGKRYLFFLKRDKEEGTFSLLTGYELDNGVVIPLDQHEQFKGLEGKREASFLDTIRSLTSASQN